TIDGGNGTDSLTLLPIGAIENIHDVTVDLRQATLTSIENLTFNGNNNTLLVDADALAGFTAITGYASSRLVISDAALDLTGKSVTGLTVQSSNATGTVFTVDNKATAFQI